MSIEKALLREKKLLTSLIIKAPHDDAPRLAYADLIRKYYNNPVYADFIYQQCAEPTAILTCMRDSEVGQFCPHLINGVAYYCPNCDFLFEHVYNNIKIIGSSHTSIIMSNHYVFNRGFLSEVALPVTTVFATRSTLARSEIQYIFSNHPVTRICTALRPKFKIKHTSNACWFWSLSDIQDWYKLHSAVVDDIRTELLAVGTHVEYNGCTNFGYATVTDAKNALSLACLNKTRSYVKLPRLTLDDLTVPKRGCHVGSEY